MNIVRYYNQNRKRIWKIVLIIFAILLLIKFLNDFTINNIKKENTSTIKDTRSNNFTSKNSTYTSTKSGVTSSNIDLKELDDVQVLLDKFFESCNNKNLQQAYDMLTDDCKEMVFPTIDSFEKNYYNNFFEGKIKSYSFKNWYNNTYYVTIKDDILANGKINNNQDSINDYITVDGEKLNIGGYIGRTKIDKTNKEKDIQITVNSKDTFINHEIYNITVKNESDKNICLTSREDSQDIYIRDKNNIKYGVYNHELLESKMIIQAGASRKLRFKFYSEYVSSKKIESIVFKNLILDYNNKDEGNTYEYSIDI